MKSACSEKYLILASGSPRRHEILEAAGIPHKIQKTDADESLPDGISPEEAVELLSMRKAESALQDAPENALILAADTVVSLNGNILGKPKDADDARRMLKELSGKKHTVFTGITISDGVKCITAHEKTVIFMRSLSPQEIDAYIHTGEPLDKAGAYGIQGRAGLFIRRLEGDYFNVVGLPLCLVGTILQKQFGFALL